MNRDIDSFFEGLGDPTKGPEFSDINYPGKRPPKNRGLTPPEKPVPAWDAKPRNYRVRGEPREFFTIGHLARALGCKPVTIRKWETERKLPVTRYRSPKPKGTQVPGKAVQGLRLYTRHQVEVVRRAASTVGVPAKDPNKPVDWALFTRMVREGWNEGEARAATR